MARARLGEYAIVALLMVAYAAGYAFSAPHTDTADELLRAYEIRHGLAYPLEGPFLGGAIHLGPLWFYLVAMPLWIHESWLAPALFIGALCSLKFPLAYWCGRRLVDSRFGVLWALAMFYPGWTSVEQLAFLNPNAVAAAVLGLLALYLHAVKSPAGARTFFTMGLAAGIALHVHPTSMPAFLLAAALLAPGRRAIALPAALALMAAGFALPFVPWLASQAMNGFADQGSAGAYVSGQIAVANLLNAPQVFVHYLVSGPEAIARYVMGWGEDASKALGWAFAALAASSLVALVPRPEMAPVRRRLPALGVACVIFFATVAFLRPTTPVQFTWVLGPVVAALVAVGLWSVARLPGGRYAAAAIALAMVVANIASIRAFAIAVRDGEGRFPSSILDIKQRGTTVFEDVWFPAWAHGRAGRILCAPARTVLHGHLAHIVDRDLATDTLFECGRRDHLWLGGSGEGRHLVGMTRPFWRALRTRPSCFVGSLGIAPIAGSAARPGIAIADGSTYLPRRAATMPAAVATYELDAPRASAVLVTNMVGRYELFEVVSAEVDGHAAVPLAANELSRLYGAAPGPGERAAWRFTVRTTNPATIDVVSLAAEVKALGHDEKDPCARQ